MVLLCPVLGRECDVIERLQFLCLFLLTGERDRLLVLTPPTVQWTLYSDWTFGLSTDRFFMIKNFSLSRPFVNLTITSRQSQDKCLIMLFDEKFCFENQFGKGPKFLCWFVLWKQSIIIRRRL